MEFEALKPIRQRRTKGLSRFQIYSS